MTAAGRLSRVAAAVVGLTLLAACGGRVLTAGDVDVVVSERTGDGMDALGAGRLSVVGGCLGLDDFVVVWPYGTDVVEEDPLRVEVPGVGTVGLGDRVEVGGGFVVEHPEGGAGAGTGALEVGGVALPPACARHDVFLSH